MSWNFTRRVWVLVKLEKVRKLEVIYPAGSEADVRVWINCTDSPAGTRLNTEDCRPDQPPAN